MTIQITQGTGTPIATAIKAAANHQRVLTHQTRIRVVANPLLNTTIPTQADGYTPGLAMGPELDFPNAFRGAPEGPPVLFDSARLEGVVVTLSGGQGPIDFDIAVLQQTLTTSPADGIAITLATGEQPQFIIPIRQSMFSASMSSTQMIATVVPPLATVVAAASVTSLQTALIARGTFTFAGGVPNATNLQITMIFQQD